MNAIEAIRRNYQREQQIARLERENARLRHAVQFLARSVELLLSDSQNVEHLTAVLDGLATLVLTLGDDPAEVLQ